MRDVCACMSHACLYMQVESAGGKLWPSVKVDLATPSAAAADKLVALDRLYAIASSDDTVSVIRSLPVAFVIGEWSEYKQISLRMQP